MCGESAPERFADVARDSEGSGCDGVAPPARGPVARVAERILFGLVVAVVAVIVLSPIAFFVALWLWDIDDGGCFPHDEDCERRELFEGSLQLPIAPDSTVLVGAAPRRAPSRSAARSSSVDATPPGQHLWSRYEQPVASRCAAHSSA